MSSSVHRCRGKGRIGRNVVDRILATPITGVGPRSATQIPVGACMHAAGRGGVASKCDPEAIFRMLRTVEAAGGDMSCRESPLISAQDREDSEQVLEFLMDQNVRFRMTFDLYLFSCTVPSLLTAIMTERASLGQHDWEIKNYCIRVLHSVVMKNRKVATDLAKEDNFLQQCLRLQMHPVTGCFASWLLTNFLEHRRDMLRLVSISNLRSILESLSVTELAQLSPYLASSLEKGKVRDESIVRENANFLCSVDGLEAKLERYVEQPTILASRLISTSPTPNMLRTWPVWVLLKVKFVRLVLLKTVRHYENEQLYMASIWGALQDFENTLEEAETTAGMNHQQ